MMPESTNDAQTNLLHTILKAVTKYCVDLQGNTAREDDLGEQKQHSLDESSASEHHSSLKRCNSVTTHLAEHLNNDENVKSLIKLLVNQQHKDEIANVWEVLSDFDEYQRNQEEDIVSYVSTFDKKYQNVAEMGISLLPEVLALKILTRANLSKQERLLITKSINFTQKDRLYEEAKRALERLGEYQDLKKMFKELRHVKGEEPNDAPGRHFLVLDSACSSTLCGKKWLDSYLEYLGKEGRDDVEYTPGEKSFVFGGGEPVKSIAFCRIPAILAGVEITIDVDVVPNDLPLIYSLSDMKKAQIRLDFTTDTAEIFGQIINLRITETGHYSVPIDGTACWKKKGIRQLSQDMQLLKDLVKRR